MCIRDSGIRGFSLTDRPLPTIVFSKESPRAQAFTIAHELAHIIINMSSICGYVPRSGGDEATRKVEEWCDSFAGAFLMPKDEIVALFSGVKETLPSLSDEKLRSVANQFCVSDHAALIRLVNLKLVAPSYYWDVKKPEFDSQIYKGGGRSKFYGTRYVASNGQLYTLSLIHI